MRIRHCPSCREDYRLEIVYCAECGGVLEDRDDELDGTATDDPAGQQPADPAVPKGFEPVHTSSDIDRLPPLADSLVAAGIDCRIREAQAHGRIVYGLLVHAKDRAAAAAIVEASLSPPATTEFDPDQGYARCPACDTPLQPRVMECPECGLPLASAEVHCPECGAIADAAADRCPSCSCSLGESG